MYLLLEQTFDRCQSLFSLFPPALRSVQRLPWCRLFNIHRAECSYISCLQSPVHAYINSTPIFGTASSGCVLTAWRKILNYAITRNMQHHSNERLHWCLWSCTQVLATKYLEVVWDNIFSLDCMEFGEGREALHLPRWPICRGCYPPAPSSWSWNRFAAQRAVRQDRPSPASLFVRRDWATAVAYNRVEPNRSNVIMVARYKLRSTLKAQGRSIDRSWRVILFTILKYVALSPRWRVYKLRNTPRYSYNANI